MSNPVTRVSVWLPTRFGTPSVFGQSTNSTSQLSAFGSQPGGSIDVGTSNYHSGTKFESSLSSGATATTVFGGSSASFSASSGQSFSFGVRRNGSRIVAYKATNHIEERDSKVQSLSAMTGYNGKSHEELRLEDYEAKDKGQVSKSPLPPLGQSSMIAFPSFSSSGLYMSQIPSTQISTNPFPSSTNPFLPRTSAKPFPTSTNPFPTSTNFFPPSTSNPFPTPTNTFPPLTPTNHFAPPTASNPTTLPTSTNTLLPQTSTSLFPNFTNPFQPPTSTNPFPPSTSTNLFSTFTNHFPSSTNAFPPSTSTNPFPPSTSTNPFPTFTNPFPSSTNAFPPSTSTNPFPPSTSTNPFPTFTNSFPSSTNAFPPSTSTNPFPTYTNPSPRNSFSRPTSPNPFAPTTPPRSTNPLPPQTSTIPFPTFPNPFPPPTSTVPFLAITTSFLPPTSTIPFPAKTTTNPFQPPTAANSFLPPTFTSPTQPPTSTNPYHPPTSVTPYFPQKPDNSFANVGAEIPSLSTPWHSAPDVQMTNLQSSSEVIGQITSSQGPAVENTVDQPLINANPFGRLPEMARLSIKQTSSNVSVQYGISSMPVHDKTSNPVRLSPLLTSRHLSHHRIRLPVGKYDSKSEGPKVAFFNKDEERPSSRTTTLVPRENPRAFVLSAELWPHKSETEELSSGTNVTPNENEEGVKSEKNTEEPSTVLNVILSAYKPDPAQTKMSKEKFTALMPQLSLPDYYTEPSIKKLAEMEKAQPGYCSRVNNFEIGRYGFGNIKFKGHTDVRNLSLDSLVEFNNREVVVYKNEDEKPPLGEGLNKEAEVTLLNINCVDKKTGVKYVEGPKVDKYKEMLIKKGKELGVEFISYDPAKGEWRFKVPHF